MIEVVAALIAVVIVFASHQIMKYKRRRDSARSDSERKSREAFLELERRRIKAFPEAMRREIQERVKEYYPGANHRTRRAIVSRYMAILKKS